MLLSKNDSYVLFGVSQPDRMNRIIYMNTTKLYISKLLNNCPKLHWLKFQSLDDVWWDVIRNTHNTNITTLFVHADNYTVTKIVDNFPQLKVLGLLPHSRWTEDGLQYIIENCTTLRTLYVPKLSNISLYFMKQCVPHLHAVRFSSENDLRDVMDSVKLCKVD